MTYQLWTNALTANVLAALCHWTDDRGPTYILSPHKYCIVYNIVRPQRICDLDICAVYIKMHLHTYLLISGICDYNDDFEIFPSKRIGVTTLTFQGHVTSSVT